MHRVEWVDEENSFMAQRRPGRPLLLTGTRRSACAMTALLSRASTARS
jgi:hypothetical protein